MNQDEKQVEALAEYVHSSWAGWMDYLFSKSEFVDNGSVIIPADLVRRWRRQAATPYHFLPEEEKRSERGEARKMIPIIEEIL